MTPHDRLRIAALATVSESTVRRAYLGRPTESTTRARIEAAAGELGYPLPPQPAQHGRQAA
jgi:DNA-binding LacI/PurR family transcriptional regulator